MPVHYGYVRDKQYRIALDEQNVHPQSPADLLTTAAQPDGDQLYPAELIDRNRRGRSRASLVPMETQFSTFLIGADRFYGDPGESPAYDWPNPRLRIRLRQADSYAANYDNLYASTPISLPDGKQELQPFVATRRKSRADHIHTSDIQLIGQDSIYGAPGEAPAYDWQVPRGPRRIRQDATQPLQVNLIGQDVIYGAPGQAPVYEMPIRVPAKRALRLDAFHALDLNLLSQDSFYGAPGQSPTILWENPRRQSNRAAHLNLALSRMIEEAVIEALPDGQRAFAYQRLRGRYRGDWIAFVLNPGLFPASSIIRVVDTIYGRKGEPALEGRRGAASLIGRKGDDGLTGRV